jgi:hypothetical protein
VAELAKSARAAEQAAAREQQRSREVTGQLEKAQSKDAAVKELMRHSEELQAQVDLRDGERGWEHMKLMGIRDSNLFSVRRPKRWGWEARQGEGSLIRQCTHKLWDLFCKNQANYKARQLFTVACLCGNSLLWRAFVLQVDRLQQSLQEERRRANKMAQSAESALAAEKHLAEAAAQELQLKMQVSGFVGGGGGRGSAGPIGYCWRTFTNQLLALMHAALALPCSHSPAMRQLLGGPHARVSFHVPYMSRADVPWNSCLACLLCAFLDIGRKPGAGKGCAAGQGQAAAGRSRSSRRQAAQQPAVRACGGAGVIECTEGLAAGHCSSGSWAGSGAVLLAVDGV